MDETTVDSVLKTTLEAQGVPVERLRYKGKADTFITFQIIYGRDTCFADDDSEGTEYTYRIDIFSKQDYIALLRNTTRALKEAGFYGITVDPEVFESETGYYHIPVEIKYMEV
jgi:hypothetical protein